MIPDYEHQIFISYRRSDGDWVKWTRDNFAKPLATLLRPGLGPTSIFIDEELETGVSWPNHLALKLSRSKIMVAVLSRDYFKSEWCRLELKIMLNREKANSLRTAARPFGLIIPVVIDDGECFPPEVKAMQAQALHEFANPFIRLDSPKQEALAEVLREKVCPAIESALHAAPKYNHNDEILTCEHFQNLFKIKVQDQTALPAMIPESIP